MKRTVLYLLVLALVSCNTTNRHDDTAFIDNTVAYCDAKVHITMSDMHGITDSMPRNVLSTDATRWNLRHNSPKEWCGGFWDGCLWYDYALTGKAEVLEEAEETADRMLYLAHEPVFDHDLGFLTITSLLNGYRLSPDSALRATYREALICCADSLATLFNTQVGTLLSWPRNMKMFGGHNTIIDNMLNLELLFWAADETQRNDLRAIAISHADTTMTYHFREDGTCYHVAVYDPLTGKHIYNCTHQGLADTSVWARGQAWAIYGYTMVYRYTREKRHLDMAVKAAEAYINLLKKTNTQFVPVWDFCDTNDTAPRDASAAAVVASALIELAAYVEEKNAERYSDIAEKTIRQLAEQYRTPKACPAILAHATGHLPAGSEIDASIIYADYYFLEALSRYVTQHISPR